MAELSTIVPLSGDPYVFTSYALWPCAAYFACLVKYLKVVITCAVIVTGISSYLNQLMRRVLIMVPTGALFFSSSLCRSISSALKGVFVTRTYNCLILLVFNVGAATEVPYIEWGAHVHWEVFELNGAIISFTFPLISFIRLRIKEPFRTSPYCSPFRIPDALVSKLLCLGGILSIFSYNSILSYDVRAALLVAILYFAVAGRVTFCDWR
ncbi:hypothetical protein PsorP6_016454 [Peronosclerospora sorghi]|uniref:Uncharacterized protein n=1 Tax=Peronosclerospora sorghi TaxID=230839 RepID=A0ACC0VMC7_9STRA|nr:hypothetical protein PsorP6_016454 [Peronosclerospora sorghi]